jgi:diguanylate cyclase
MSTHPEQRRTLRYAAAALAKIVELELPGDPRSFELWYVYATGQNPDLNRDVDEILGRQSKILTSDLGRLYSLHLSSARATNALSSLASKLTAEVGHVVGAIHSAVSSAERYDATLNDAVGAAHQRPAIDIGSILGELVQATESMVRENGALKGQLEASRVRSEELSDEIDRIRLESLLDPLTQIGNRQFFDEALAKAITKATRNAAPLTLLFIDIDNFKQINDRFGHQIGDDVLRLVASKMKSNVRHGEVARYGGEEFGIILYNKLLEIGRLIAERIREAVESVEMRDRASGDSFGRVTVSVGVAEWNPGSTASDLIGRADAALYIAKRKGRNCVAVADGTEALRRAAQIA